MRFSVTGFLVGAVCAVVLVIVALAILPAFAFKGLLVALLAIALWVYLTFNWPWRRRRDPTL